MWSGPTRYYGSGLQGFAQAHIIRQNPVQPATAEKSQPADACLLIWPQLAFYFHRQAIILHLFNTGLAMRVDAMCTCASNIHVGKGDKHLMWNHSSDA